MPIIYGFTTDFFLKIFFEKIFKKNLSLISFKNFDFKDFSGRYHWNLCNKWLSPLQQKSIEIAKFFVVVCFWFREKSTFMAIYKKVFKKLWIYLFTLLIFEEFFKAFFKLSPIFLCANRLWIFYRLFLRFSKRKIFEKNQSLIYFKDFSGEYHWNCCNKCSPSTIEFPLKLLNYL